MERDDPRVRQQGGILTPSEAPLVLVVTGEEGGQYGYDDFWDDDGVFHYYGAGQVGRMELVRGNRALRDHSENGEEVHLFEQAQPSGLRYDGPVWSAPATTSATTFPTARAICVARSCSSSWRSTTSDS